jgi:hypothetical protein
MSVFFTVCHPLISHVLFGRKPKGEHFMRVTIFLSLISFTILNLTIPGYSQTPRTVRWQESEANSSQFFRNGVMVKRLRVDGVDGITVSASIRDRADSFSVELELENHSQIVRYLKTRDIQLEVIHQWSKSLLLYISPETLARRLVDEANRRATRVEDAARFATRTETKHVPVTETSFNPASTNDPTQPVHITTTRIDVVTEIVPDNQARFAAKAEAGRIRREAEAEYRHILGAALNLTYIESNSRKRGMIYYDRIRYLQNVLLRIPLGELTVEIPFKVTRTRFFLRSHTFKFE